MQRPLHAGREEMYRVCISRGIQILQDLRCLSQDRLFLPLLRKADPGKTPDTTNGDGAMTDIEARLDALEQRIQKLNRAVYLMPELMDMQCKLSQVEKQINRLEKFDTDTRLRIVDHVTVLKGVGDLLREHELIHDRLAERIDKVDKK